MRAGIIGTGAIAHKHAQVYRNLGWSLAACNDIGAEQGRAFAALYGCEFVSTPEQVCHHPGVDFVDVCTFPDFRLQPVRWCAESGKAVQVQKPIATSLETARAMIDAAAAAGIALGVVSQRRFDDSTRFLRRALAEGRLGRVLEADAYVKWHRGDDYYARKIKGSWETEGGGALINQAIHQVDMLLWLIGPLEEVVGQWQLGASHAIESEDIVNALFRYRSGATGVVQASTSFRPGYVERIEIHGTKGAAIVSGDKLTAWDVEDDGGEPPPLEANVSSGASDPMAISLVPFERQFADFAEAIRDRREPLSSGEDAYRALEAVLAVYRSCREGVKVRLNG